MSKEKIILSGKTLAGALGLPLVVRFTNNYRNKRKGENVQ